MDAGLLEKYNSGKAVINNEIRQLALTQETMAKQRAAFGTSTVLGTSNGGSTHSNGSASKESIVRNPFLPSFSDKTAPKYTNLEMSAPIADDDDDDLGPSIYTATSGAWRSTSAPSSAVKATPDRSNIRATPDRSTTKATPDRHVHKPSTQTPSPPKARVVRDFTLDDFNDV